MLTQTEVSFRKLYF